MLEFVKASQGLPQAEQYRIIKGKISDFVPPRGTFLRRDRGIK